MSQLRLLIPPYFGLDLVAKIRREAGDGRKVGYHFNGSPIHLLR